MDSVAIGVVPRDEPTRQNGGDSMMRAAGSLLFGSCGVIGNAVKEGTSEVGKQLYTQTRRGVNVVSEWRWNDCGRGSRHRALLGYRDGWAEERRWQDANFFAGTPNFGLNCMCCSNTGGIQ